MRLSRIIRTILNISSFLSLKLNYGKKIQICNPRYVNGKISFTAKEGTIRIGKKVYITSGTLIRVNKGRIELGDGVFFNRNCTVVSHCSIKIGARCIFGPNVLIYDHDHNFNHEGFQPGYKTAEVSIGQNCWIGGGAIILRGSHIGDGCVIGAGAIVKGEIPPYSLVVANREMIIKSLVKRE